MYVLCNVIILITQDRQYKQSSVALEAQKIDYYSRVSAKSYHLLFISIWNTWKLMS